MKVVGDLEKNSNKSHSKNSKDKSLLNNLITNIGSQAKENGFRTIESA